MQNPSAQDDDRGRLADADYEPEPILDETDQPVPDSDGPELEQSSTKRPELGRGLGALVGKSTGNLKPAVPGLPETQNGVQRVLKICDITVDRSLQARVRLNEKKVIEYAQYMKDGVQFPPVEVCRVDGKHFLTDGGHRLASAKKAGLKTFPAMIRQGTRQDAIRYAIQANRTHGLARTNADKRRAVEMALEEFSDQSDHALADLCGVSQTFVSKLRPQLKTVFSSVKRVGRDGKRRKVPEAKPAKRASSETSHGQDAQAGKAADDPCHDRGSNRTHPTDDQKESSSGSARKESKFRLKDAWARIEQFLLGEVASWPKKWHHALGQQLQAFADEHCD